MPYNPIEDQLRKLRELNKVKFIMLNTVISYDDNNHKEKFLYEFVACMVKNWMYKGYFNNNIILPTRFDLIGDYMGLSSKKTFNFLNDNIGNTICIDLDNIFVNDYDIFGDEVLNIIEHFMEQNIDDIVIILVGHKNRMSEIFKKYPELERRFTWKFDI